MPATLTRVDGNLVLDLSTARGFEFNDALNQVRDIPGKRFDWESKLWYFPEDPATCDQVLVRVRPEMDKETRDWLLDAKSRLTEEVTTPLPPDGDVLIPWGTRRMPWQPETVNDLAFEGLFPFQRSAVAHLARVCRAILADDMGLGKTIQAISVVEEYRRQNPMSDGTLVDKPKLIIAPKSVKGAWLRELNRWLEPGQFNVRLIDHATAPGRHKQLTEAIQENAWTIVNWESLRVESLKLKITRRNGATSKRTIKVMKEPLFQVPWAALDELSLDDLDFRAIERYKKAPEAEFMNWLAVIADEIHRAKNPRALQSQGLYRTRGDLMLGLTGTPIMNSPGELWSLLHWLWPQQYSSYERFENQFVDYYEIPGQQGKIVTGVKNPDALRFELRGRVVRRTAEKANEAMGRKLPGHRRVYFPIEMTAPQRKAYKDAEKEMWLAIEKGIDEGSKADLQLAETLMRGDGPAAIHRISNGGVRTLRLRQILENVALLGGPDSSGMMDEFEDRFDDSRPEPWLFFAEFRESCDLMAERLRKRHGAKVAVFTGDTPAYERTAIEDAFQAGELDAICGTIGALREGVTLTRANRGYFGSRSWVPAWDEQGEARYANRTGQSRYSTTYIPQVPNTVATDKVEPKVRLKDKITRAVHEKDTIKEVHQ